MADDVNVLLSIRMDTSKIEAALKDLERILDRANMYGIRAGGRKVKQAGRRTAPKLTGALRDSIASSKRLRGSRASYSLTVAPHVDYAYSNAAQGYGDNAYMERAMAEGEAAMVAAFVAAYSRVLSRYGLG